MRKIFVMLALLFAVSFVSATTLETHGTETLVQEKIENTNAYISDIFQKYDVYLFAKETYEAVADRFGITKEDAEEYNVFVYFDAADPTDYAVIILEENEVKFILYRK